MKAEAKRNSKYEVKEGTQRSPRACVLSACKAAQANPPPAQAPAISNDAILPRMESQNQPPAWIETAKRRGKADLLLSLLDAIEPIAPVLAQGLIVAEPLALLWGGGGALRALAEQLEEPGGVEALRQQLMDEAAE